MKTIAIALALAGVAASVEAQTLKPELAGLSFLVGKWSSGKGVVAETGGSSAGSSNFKVEANGAVLLRQDRTELFDKAGKPTGAFDQVMMIYSENGALHGDYSDGTHIIHYVDADVSQGKSVAFSSTKNAGAPVFRLTYTLTAPDTLSVSFGIIPPGGTAFAPIATGTLRRDR